MDNMDGCIPTGYSIIQPESLEAAVSMAKTYPIQRDWAKISVYETFGAIVM